MKAYEDLSKSNINENRRADKIRKTDDKRKDGTNEVPLKSKQQGMAASYPGDFSNSAFFKG